MWFLWRWNTSILLLQCGVGALLYGLDFHWLGSLAAVIFVPLAIALLADGNTFFTLSETLFKLLTFRRSLSIGHQEERKAAVGDVALVGFLGPLVSVLSFLSLVAYEEGEILFVFVCALMAGTFSGVLAALAYRAGEYMTRVDSSRHPTELFLAAFPLIGVLFVPVSAGVELLRSAITRSEY